MFEVALQEPWLSLLHRLKASQILQTNLHCQLHIFIIFFLNSSCDCILSLPRSAIELQVQAVHYELVNIIHTPIP